MLVAERLGAEIVSVDSMQVYKGMDVGTAKPAAEEIARVPHHMIDIVDPEVAFSVAEFQVRGRLAMAEIGGRGARVLIVGGSGLHFRSLVDPLEFPPTDDGLREVIEGMSAEEATAELLAADPEAGVWVDLSNPRRVIRALEIHRLTGLTPTVRATAPTADAVREYRPEIPVAVVGVDPGEQLPARVERRLDGMIERGLLDEVDGLRGRLGTTAATAVGYREMLRVVEGEWDLATARKRAVDATTSLARRQRTYHRRDPRIDWLGWQDDPVLLAEAAVASLEGAGWTS
jgi:tRNA dimethylallyltransferase